MGGHYGHTPGRKVLSELRLDQPDAARVEVGEGLVQQPEAGARQRHPGQSYPTLLAGREHTDWQPKAGLKAKGPECRGDRGRWPTGESRPESQVLQGRKVCLERIVVAQKRGVRVKSIGIVTDRLASPENRAIFWPDQAGENAYQGGLADSVGSGQVQAVPRGDPQREPADDMPITPPRVHAAGFETRLPTRILHDSTYLDPI